MLFECGCERGIFVEGVMSFCLTNPSQRNSVERTVLCRIRTCETLNVHRLATGRQGIHLRRSRINLAAEHPWQGIGVAPPTNHRHAADAKESMGTAEFSAATVRSPPES
jgi:hypothetical protein